MHAHHKYCSTPRYPPQKQVPNRPGDNGTKLILDAKSLFKTLAIQWAKGMQSMLSETTEQQKGIGHVIVCLVHDLKFLFLLLQKYRNVVLFWHAVTSILICRQSSKLAIFTAQKALNSSSLWK